MDQARCAAAMSRARSCVSQVKPSPMVCQAICALELRERVALGGVPGALDELHDADAAAAAQHAQRETEGRGRFPFAGAGVDDQQTLFDGLAGDLRILHGLALGHLVAMAFRLGVVGRLRHCRISGLLLTYERQARDHENDAIGLRRHALIENSLPIAKLPAERMLRNDAKADFIGDHDDRRFHRRHRFFQAADFAIDVGTREHEI